MGDSEYIFEEGTRGFYAGIVVGSLLVLFMLYQLYRIYKNDKYFWGRDDSDKHTRRLWPALGFGLLGLVVLCFSPRTRAFYGRLKKNHAETIGVTTFYQSGGGNSSPTVEYQFTVNGKLYKDYCGITYGGELIHGIKVPGGHYKVIYNKHDPTESVMDFKADTSENK